MMLIALTLIIITVTLIITALLTIEKNISKLFSSNFDKTIVIGKRSFRNTLDTIQTKKYI